MNKKKIIFRIISLGLIILSCFLFVKQYFLLHNNKNIQKDSLDIEEINAEQKNIIEFCILGNEIIKIDKERFDDFGTGRLENRWELNEIDKIMKSLKGVWEIDQYIGFVDSSIYYPDLFDDDNLDKSVKNSLNNAYNEKVKNAKENLPEICLSIREENGQETEENYIYTQGYSSPISITLSLDILNDYYPIFVDQNAISKDFNVEYPVLYIRFMLYKEEKYNPATLVVTSDGKFYILMEGAFYSLKRN